MKKKRKIVKGRRYSHYVWELYNPNNLIKKGELIHHIDRDYSNDVIENLQKMSFSEHTILHHTGRIVSQETKCKMSKILKGRPLSKKHIESLRNCIRSNRGINNSMFGKKHSEETKYKMREAHKNRVSIPCSEEKKLKISKANKGKKRTKEQVLRMSLVKKGKKLSEETKRKIGLSHIGKRHSEETCKKISETRKRFLKEGKYLYFKSKEKST